MDALQGGLSREATQGTLLQHFPPDALFTKKFYLFDVFLAELLISIPWTGTFAYCCQKKETEKHFLDQQALTGSGFSSHLPFLIIVKAFIF